MIEPLGVIKVDRHFLTEGFVTVSNHIKQIANRNNISNGQILTLFIQQLCHDLQCGAFTLQYAGNSDQCLNQSRAEWIDLAKHFAVSFSSQQSGHHGLTHLRRFFKRRIQLFTSRIVMTSKNSSRSNRWQITVFQRDFVKSAFPITQCVAEIEPFRTRHSVANEFPQVSLPRHETDQRNRTIGRLSFHQFGKLLSFTLDEFQIRGMAGEPQNQLVQKQNNGVVTEPLCVSTDNRQSLIN